VRRIKGADFNSLGRELLTASVGIERFGANMFVRWFHAQTGCMGDLYADLGIIFAEHGALRLSS